MDIHNDIQQVQFRNGHNKAMVNILYTNSWMLEKIKNFVRQENITAQQYNILRILRGAGKPLTTLEIRERMLDKMSDTSRIVERLVGKGLAQKSISEKDKRKVDVIITAEGYDLLNRLDDKNYELDRVMESLSTDELETLNNLLNKLRNHH